MPARIGKRDLVLFGKRLTNNLSGVSLVTIFFYNSEVIFLHLLKANESVFIKAVLFEMVEITLNGWLAITCVSVSFM